MIQIVSDTFPFMDMVVGKRLSSPWFNCVRFPRATDTHAFPTRHFLAFLWGEHCSKLVVIFKTLASDRAAIVPTIVRCGHDEWIQSAALVVAVVGQEGKGKVKKRRNKNDEWGGTADYDCNGRANVSPTRSRMLGRIRAQDCCSVLVDVFFRIRPFSFDSQIESPWSSCCDNL